MDSKNVMTGKFKSIMNQSNCQLVGLARDPVEVHLTTLHRGKLQAISVLGNEACEEGNHQSFWSENFMGSGGKHKVSWKEACVEGNKNKN